MRVQKVFSMFVAVIMVLGMMSFPALAAESWDAETPVTTAAEFAQACTAVSTANGSAGETPVLLGSDIILAEDLSVEVGGNLYFTGNGYQVYGNGHTLSFTANQQYVDFVKAGEDVAVSVPPMTWGNVEFGEPQQAGDVVLSNTSAPLAAKIDGVYYTSFDAAVKAAESGDVITLVNDIVLTETYTIANTNPITIDFGGYYIDVTQVDVDTNSLYIASGANVTFMGQGGIKGNKNCLTNGGTVTLNGGTYSTKLLGRGSALYNEAGGIMNVHDGVIVDAYYFGIFNETGAACNLHGGMIESHARTGLDPNNAYTYAYTIRNGGTMDVYDGVTVKGIQGAFAASGEGVTQIYGGDFLTHEDEAGAENRSFYACYAANNANLTIYGGTFTAAKRAAIYIGNEDVGLDGANVKIQGGTFVSNGGVNAAVIQTDIKGSLNITGGNYSSDVSKYMASGYYQIENPDGTFTVQKSAAQVIDTAKTTGAEITLENLSKNDAVDHTEDATYKVVVKTAPQEDVEKVNEIIAQTDNKDKAIFDIAIVKESSNGVITDVSKEITDQPVTLTLGETPVADSVKVYHVTDAGVEEISSVTVEGNTVTFTAASFSTYAVSYDAMPVEEEKITKNIGIVFSPVAEGSNQYNITLKALDQDTVINRFMSADLVFKNDAANIGYEITPAANMTSSFVSANQNSTEYRFSMDGITASSVTGSEITIGTITFSGYDVLNFSVDKAYTAGYAVNIVNTAEIRDNIVDSYMLAGDGVTTGKLVVNDEFTDGQLADGETGIITGELKPAQKNLTVNVVFPNAVSDNVAAYQEMKATISGGDLSESIVKNLGTDDVAQTDGGYSFTQALTQNISYMVTIEGKGYRTVRYTVNMRSDKELTFWNNVKDQETVIEKGNDASTAKVTFLAGDIVEDNKINVYDLSAVVSYFGTVNDVTAGSDYVKYDLNRDGKVDSKDVAMVLVSWNE